MLKLLVIKEGGSYIRVENNDGDIGFKSCFFDKASVFPESEIETVLEYNKRLTLLGRNTEVRRLIIEEQAYRED